jgi:mannose-6-phosphate isomerase-like protein (cupin superfamily)
MTRTADLPGLKNRYLIDSADTDGRFALIEHRIPPRTLAAPVHTHEREDEYSYVLTGRLTAQIGDEIVEAGPGDMVLKPRGIPHTFWNAGDEPVRFLEVLSPAAFEEYFFALAAPLNAGDFEGMAAVAERHALALDPSSIPALVAEHGLQPPR